MKDAKHHLKNLQKKVIKSSKRENLIVKQTGSVLSDEERVVNFKRPKTVQNRRKTA